MAKRKNLSDQLNEYNMDDENLCGINFAIHKNVMIWGGTIIQLSNISSISQYNNWEKEKKTIAKKQSELLVSENLENPIHFLTMLSGEQLYVW